MKYLKKIDEIVSKFDKEKREYIFDPSDYPKDENVATFYLHKDKQGFMMEIKSEDQEKLEEILKRNKIDYTVSVEKGNVLPF
jgi:hypothetical protein